MIKLQTVVKLSGFCNFRCAYCYEFDRLGDPTRMTSDLLTKTARDVGAWCATLATRSSGPVHMTFVLHGGEPLILPLDYLEAVVATLRGAAGPGVTVDFSVQTNAYGIKTPVLDFLRRESIAISVSHDVICGSRISAGGRAVEARVDETICHLHAEGLLNGGITVVNRVTAPHLIRIHTYWRQRGCRYMLLPLDKNGGPRSELYGISEEESADALTGLAAHLLDTGEAIDMYPLDDTFRLALVHVAGLGMRNVGRLDFGRTVFVVNTDGGVFDQTATDYDEASKLGDLTVQTFAEIVEGPAIRRLHALDTALEAATCHDCNFRAACNRWPLFVDAARDERCGVSYRLVERMVHLLIERGIDRTTATAFLTPAGAGRLDSVDQRVA